MSGKVKKYLGVDWGEKRIGLALGDSETKIASPFKVVGNIKEVVKIIKDENVDAVIVGAPFKMAGAEVKMAKDFLEFLDLLKKKIKIPVEQVDERLTSKAADALGGGKKIKAARDAVAAMIILQGYLDKKM